MKYSKKNFDLLLIEKLNSNKNAVKKAIRISHGRFISLNQLQYCQFSLAKDILYFSRGSVIAMLDFNFYYPQSLVALTRITYEMSQVSNFQNFKTLK